MEQTEEEEAKDDVPEEITPVKEEPKVVETPKVPEKKAENT